MPARLQNGGTKYGATVFFVPKVELTDSRSKP